MIITKIIGNIHEVEIGKRHREKIYVESGDLLKRVQRVVSDHGNEFGIRLERGEQLKQGDILVLNERNVVYIDVLSENVLVIKPTSLKQMGEIAHAIGNRHTPAQFLNNEMIVSYDYLLEEMIQQYNVPYAVEERTLQEAFRPIGHHHD